MEKEQLVQNITEYLASQNIRLYSTSTTENALKIKIWEIDLPGPITDQQNRLRGLRRELEERYKLDIITSRLNLQEYLGSRQTEDLPEMTELHTKFRLEASKGYSHILTSQTKFRNVELIRPDGSYVTEIPFIVLNGRKVTLYKVDSSNNLTPKQRKKRALKRAEQFLKKNFSLDMLVRIVERKLIKLR